MSNAFVDSDSKYEDATIGFTATQRQRLHELGASDAETTRQFDSAATRDETYKELERNLARQGRVHLTTLRETTRRPRLLELEEQLASALRRAGFVQVATPTLVSRDALRRMGIDSSHPLAEQVFWIDDQRCLRPMLAPNLYTLMRRLARIWRQPFGIFEIGSCFRRDTKGASHLNEFTMANLVELGTPLGQREARLKALVDTVMAAVGLGDYEVVVCQSEVYGQTFDVVAGADRLEVCSAALGPHSLDDAWGITDPWVGLGFGLERLLIARDSLVGIERVGRSLAYLDGVRLNV